ncbi:helix-turn-helix domain-containing protein [Rhizobium alvei]|uniref:Helix-turn-helix transcriptional regulator n=1 Tax=Rhizobium alvei TaxID=1132659 RepID=A0ABT8YG67_9HYPH|nr:helix-turn-helix transcriptional regulator [Rhizobium alvei]MDO6962348.1 helix-turn-helix transcriptional regulator [Rhizobium alvei]
MTMVLNGRQYKVENVDYGLTHMELECLRLTAHGVKAQEISQQLNASEREIEILLYCVERKLNARNRLHAVGIAVAKGLIGIEL